MDTRKLIDILRSSLHPVEGPAAEEQLSQINKLIGFPTSLLQVIMSNTVAVPVRQAGVVYLKNLITSNWSDKDQEDDEPQPFTIHEQDKAMIRDRIVDAIIQSPEMIRIQLCLCLKTVIKHDFPTRWTQIVDKIHIYLQNPEPNSWMGALMCLYQLIKNFEFYFHVQAKRAPLIEAMNLLLPMIYTLIVNLQQDRSAESMLIQQQILKCYYTLIKFALPQELITREIFTKWMEVLRSVMEQPVPEETLQVDEEERLELPWWKCKKWAIHTLYRLFERYGSPVNVREEYVQFAEWYLTTFTGGILETLFRILDQYRHKVYISPRVLQQTISYIDQCVIHSHSWKLLKPHMFAIIQDVIFPLLCYSKADDEMWQTDPHEYIRTKFDIFEDYISPVTAAQTLLVSCCKKRKDMLERTMNLCMQVLNSRNGEYDARHRDGALHVVGTLNEILMKKSVCKEEIDSLLNQYVFPEFQSPMGYMRARACWVLHSFASVRFKNEQLLLEAVRLVVNALLRDNELPVKVEAAIAIQMLLTSQDKVHKYIEPDIKNITSELLTVIRETENDNLASVLQKVVPLYPEQLMPMACEIIDHLASTFAKVMETDSGTDEKAIAAMGLLNTMETVLNVMEDSPDIMAHLETTVLRVSGDILQHSVIEYYEEAMSLLNIVSSKKISPDMWKMLELIYKVFETEGFDYFNDMMPVLYNYVTVDTNAFVSNENHILAMFNMCKAVLTSEPDDEIEVYAAKLLEVMVLQCSGKIDNCLPSFVELVLSRLTRKVKTSELRTMLLQVLIAILYYNPHLLFSILAKLQEAVPNASISQHFLKQWIHDTDCFVGLHDKKLYILGMCTLLKMGSLRPNLDEIMPKIMPSCLVLFEGLKKAYEARAAADEESSSSEGEEEEDEVVVLSSDEDDIDDMNSEYLNNLARMVVKNSAQQGLETTAFVEDLDDSDDDDDLDYVQPDDSGIENYTTILDDKDSLIDEYITFKNTLAEISESDPELYHMLMSSLTDEQKKRLNAVCVLADQRRAQRDSKRIEQSGGYSFTVPTQVPTKFKFGS